MTYRKLTDLLAEISPLHVYTYRRNLLNALRLGLIDMVPVPGTRTLTRHDKSGEPIPWEVQEHLVHDTPAFRAWHQREVSVWTANHSTASALRGLVVTEDALARGEVDFAEVARRYRERLNPRKARRGKGRKRPKGNSASPTEAVLPDRTSGGKDTP